jgi:hypothetical protein
MSEHREPMDFVVRMATSLSDVMDQEPMAIKQAIMAHLATYFRSVARDELASTMAEFEFRITEQLDESVPADQRAVFLEFANLAAACRVAAVLEVIRRDGHGVSDVLRQALAWACAAGGGRRRLLTFLDLLRHGFHGEAFPPGVGEAAVSYERHDAVSEFLCALSRVVGPAAYVGEFTEAWPKIHAMAGEDRDARMASLTFTYATLMQLVNPRLVVFDPNNVLRVIASDGAPRWDVPFAVDTIKWCTPESKGYGALLAEMLAQEVTFLLAVARHPVCPYTHRVAPMGQTWEHASEHVKKMRDDAMLSKHRSLVEKARSALRPQKPATFQGFVDFICEHGLLNAAVFQRRPNWKITDLVSLRQAGSAPQHPIDLTGDEDEVYKPVYVRVADMVPQEEMAKHPDFPSTYRVLGACDPLHLTAAKMPDVLEQVVDFYRLHRPGIVDDPTVAHLKAVIKNAVGSAIEECDGAASATRHLCVNRLVNATS